MIEKIEDKIKKFHIIIAILTIAVFQYIFPFVFHIGNDKLNEEKIKNVSDRVFLLENGYLSNRDILLELRFNLKEHMRKAGTEYQENTDVINQIKNE